MITIRVTVQDNASATIRRVGEAIARPRAIVEAASQAVVVGLQKHFRARNSEGNKRGWPSKNFWVKEGFNKTGISSISDTEATVSVASPAIAFKQRGGTITAKRGKYLAIPLTAQAYAAGSPREANMPGLVFCGGRLGGNAFLGVPSGQFKSIVRHYLLTPKVTQAADPRALPDQATLESAAGRAAARALRTLVNGGGN